MNFDRNLIDLIKEAHKWEYTDINDTHASSLSKKPKFYFTGFQWFIIFISGCIVIVCPKGIDVDFAGHVLAAMSLLVGILFSLVIFLFDKFLNIDFKPYRKSVNQHLYKYGVRLKNYFKKTIILTLYTAIIAIVCIVLLSAVILCDQLSHSVNYITFICNIRMFVLFDICKVFLLFMYRIILFYFLLNFLYITKTLITSFFDYMISEITDVNLN